jgi:hypothetical protein
MKPPRDDSFRPGLNLLYQRAVMAACAHPALADAGLAALWRERLANEIVFALWPGEVGKGGHYFMPIVGIGLLRRTILEGKELQVRVSGIPCRDGGHATTVQQMIVWPRKPLSIAVNNDGDPARPAA